MSSTVVVIALIVGSLFFLVYRKNRWYRFDIWLISWFRHYLNRRHGLPHIPDGTCRHIIFCFVDHFEPGTGGVDSAQSLNRFNAWVNGFPPLANQFQDSDGRPPQHTFFFPPNYFCDDFLSRLAAFDWNGYGEVEFHLHHSGDTSESLRVKIKETIKSYSQYGVFLTEGDPVGRSYGFVHGDWALDNSRPEYCGVNDELTILSETGCYADFTFPSLGPAQPSVVNTIYRAKDDPKEPKSYNTGVALKAGIPGEPSDLMLITGPIGFRSRRKFPGFAVEDADVTGEAPGTFQRVREWVRTGIHVSGRPEWIFVKVHTHGAVERHWDALLGQGAERMWTTLCEEFNDGKEYKLHFVTAREMYNIARAAELGMTGNPHKWRDFEIPAYLSRSILSNKPFRAMRFTDECFELHWEDFDSEILVKLKKSPIRVLKGVIISATLTDMELILTGRGLFIVGLIKNWSLRGSGVQLSPVEKIKEDGVDVDIYQCWSKEECVQLDLIKND